jgi:hypothetical protein
MSLKQKGIVGTERNLEGIVKEVDDHHLRREPTRLPSASSLARRLFAATRHQVSRCASAGEGEFGLAKARRQKTW